MTTQPTQPRPPNIAHRPHSQGPFADRLRSPATPSHCQDHAHTRHAGKRRAQSAHLLDRRAQEDVRDDQAVRDIQVCIILSPGSPTAISETASTRQHRHQFLTMTHKHRGQARQTVSEDRDVLDASEKRLCWSRAPGFSVKSTTRDLTALFWRAPHEVVSPR